MQKFLSMAIACITFTVACSQTGDVAKKLDEYFKAAQNAGMFNGTALVVEKGNTILNMGYGYKDAETKAPATANTIYQIGSVTKQFTAAVILQLAEQGKLKLDDKVSKYFPSLPNAERVRIENLLSHTSGYFNYTNLKNFMMNEVAKPIDQKGMFALFADSALGFEPGTKFSYSNSGYVILGYIIEKVTGKKYEQVVRKQIFTPLQMSHSGFDFTHLADADKAVGYNAFPGSNTTRSPIVDSTVSFSAGAIYSTVGDIYKWNQALSSEKILKKKSLQNAFTPRLNKYGFGWGIDTIDGRRMISHNGGIHGFVSHNSFFPNDNIYVTLLSNSGASKMDQVIKEVRSIVFGKPYALPQVLSEIKVDTGILFKYVGEYELSPAFIITVSLTNGSLKAQATGQPSFDLFAKTENIFFLKAVVAEVEFIKNDKQVVEKLILHQNGQHMQGRKIR